MPDDSIRFWVDHHLHTDSLHHEGDQNLGSGWKNSRKYTTENDWQNVPVAKTWEEAGKTSGSIRRTTEAIEFVKSSRKKGSKKPIKKR